MHLAMKKITGKNYDYLTKKYILTGDKLLIPFFDEEELWVWGEKHKTAEKAIIKKLPWQFGRDDVKYAIIQLDYLKVREILEKFHDMRQFLEQYNLLGFAVFKNDDLLIQVTYEGGIFLEKASEEFFEENK